VLFAEHGETKPLTALARPHARADQVTDVRHAMATDVIVLNGGSSSGKSSIARRLQDLLDQPWITLGVDDLLDASAPS
jgi:chloramphenicol 3-O-phosphotransferase